MNANEYAEGYRKTANIFEGPNRIDISLNFLHQNEQRVCSNFLDLKIVFLSMTVVKGLDICQHLTVSELLR